MKFVLLFTIVLITLNLAFVSCKAPFDFENNSDGAEFCNQFNELKKEITGDPFEEKFANLVFDFFKC